MSRCTDSLTIWLGCFPRVSGDEPAAGNLQATLMGFSPRERG